MADPTLRKYRSANAYDFSAEQTAAIVRSTTYHRTDPARTVIWFPPQQHIGINMSIATPFQRIPSTGIGALDQLPLEVLHEVLLYSDMQTLFNFRQTNLRARESVDSSRQYQLVVLHGLNLYCALMRTQLAKSISLFEFFDALCTKACTFCGEFGGFMSLITWKRCCFTCVHHAPETRMQTLAAVKKQYHLTNAESKQLKSFKTLPGTYTTNQSSQKSRITVVAAHQAALAFNHRQRAPTVMAGLHIKLNSMGASALPYYDRGSGRAEHGLYCGGCQLALEKIIIINRGTRWAYKAREKVYAQDKFLEHFRWCEQAQFLWDLSSEGQRQLAEVLEGVRRGGYLDARA